MRVNESSKVVPTYVYHGCGFPVTILNAPMKKFRDQWFLDIDTSVIDEKVAFQIAAQSARMTGKQTEFIRKWSSMTMREMAKILSVSHVAVHKWEQAGSKATLMDINTERVFRAHIFIRLGFSPAKTLEIITTLNAKAKAMARTDAMQLNAEELRSA